MRILTGKRILIISSEPWDSHFLSKHHLAIALSRLGNQVYFLNPPSGENKCSTAIGYTSLFLVDYKPFVKGLHFLPSWLAATFSKRDAENIKKITHSDFDLVWTFDPFRFQDIRIFKARWTLYHVADIHHAKNEDKLAGAVQLILGPSVQLIERFPASKSVCIGHMVSEEFLNVASATATRVPGRIRIGYVGNLLSRFLDYPLLVKTVQCNPEIDFSFIGQKERIHENEYWRQLIGLGHVHFEGPVSYEDLTQHFARFDMFWCCYDTEKFFREASNSHKIMEYLATGKPVVSTRMAFYLQEDGILCMPEKNNLLPELLKTVASSLEQRIDTVNQEKRIRFVREHTYERSLSQIDELLSAL